MHLKFLNQNLACFVLYLKIINTVLKSKRLYIVENFEKLKTGVKFFKGKQALGLLIKSDNFFWSITQERFDLLKF